MTSDRNTIVLLHRLAHARTGDKGNRSNISVIAYRAEDYALLVAEVTEARVIALFADRRPTAVKRYLLPKIAAMNFVLDDVLDGGVNDSLNLDTHGKSLSFHLLTLPIALPGMPPPAYDGVTELWFDTIEAIGLVFSSSQYIALIRPDEANFLDLTGCDLLVTAENPVL